MFKNRFLVVIGVISLLLVTIAVSSPLSNTSLATDQGASDFYQRHPDWIWTVRNGNVDSSASSDYFQRHPELTVPSILGLGASDYFMRHPELTLSADASVDMTDYYFRHTAAFPSFTNIDLTDYFFRHP